MFHYISYFLLVVIIIIQCNAQTYPYTLTDTVTESYFASLDYYQADFAVYGNVKTLAGIVVYCFNYQ